MQIFLWNLERWNSYGTNCTNFSQIICNHANDLIHSNFIYKSTLFGIQMTLKNVLCINQRKCHFHHNHFPTIASLRRPKKIISRHMNTTRFKCLSISSDSKFKFRISYIFKSFFLTFPFTNVNMCFGASFLSKWMGWEITILLDSSFFLFGMMTSTKE